MNGKRLILYILFSPFPPNILQNALWWNHLQRTGGKPEKSHRKVITFIYSYICSHIADRSTRVWGRPVHIPTRVPFEFDSWVTMLVFYGRSTYVRTCNDSRTDYSCYFYAHRTYLRTTHYAHTLNRMLLPRSAKACSNATSRTCLLYTSPSPRD